MNQKRSEKKQRRNKWSENQQKSKSVCGIDQVSKSSQKNVCCYFIVSFSSNSVLFFYYIIFHSVLLQFPEISNILWFFLFFNRSIQHSKVCAPLVEIISTAHIVLDNNNKFWGFSFWKKGQWYDADMIKIKTLFSLCLLWLRPHPVLLDWLNPTIGTIYHWDGEKYLFNWIGGLTLEIKT